MRTCYRQYQRGFRCYNRFGNLNLYAARVFCEIYFPEKEDEQLSFIAGWEAAKLLTVTR